MEIFREQNLKVESPAAALKAARRFPGYQVFTIHLLHVCVFPVLLSLRSFTSPCRQSF